MSALDAGRHRDAGLWQGRLPSSGAALLFLGWMHSCRRDVRPQSSVLLEAVDGLHLVLSASASHAHYHLYSVKPHTLSLTHTHTYHKKIADLCVYAILDFHVPGAACFLSLQVSY